MDNHQKFQAKSKYARYLEEERSRESWPQTVDRYIEFFKDKHPNVDSSIWEELRDAILSLTVMPSMRCMMTAGKALELDNVAGYNCSYLPIDSPRAFDELMYILMCGTGVGFSVERQYIQKLPEVAEEMHETDTVIVVADSKIGWASAFRELLAMLYAGKVPSWDLSKLRPEGARLKTFGGRSSGPGPLDDLFKWTVNMFGKAVGRKITSLEAHDLACKTADSIVVGGVRRSALISLSNLSDPRMANAKHGQWWETEGQRALSNNSVCYTEKPEFDAFLEEWRSLYASKSGERGFFNRTASKRCAERTGRRDTEWDFGTNPCSEIVLRPNQFCNLSEVVVRSDDTIETLKSKVRLATILGTLQSTLTDFRYLRKVWKRNTEEERLLGVSLTGIMDHPILSGVIGTDDMNYFGSQSKSLGEFLEEIKEVAIETNKEWADSLGISQSTSITCVKPSGTVSQLVDSASGIHPRFAPYYLRRSRASASDPLAIAMQEAGYPHEVSVTNPRDLIFEFPIKAPDGSICVKDVGAMQQLKHWKIFQDHWCEHKPSITVYYKDEEFLEVGQWVWDNFDDISGIAFMPVDDHIYRQPPYEEIDQETYEKLFADVAHLDIAALDFTEDDDNTTGSQELACTSATGCEI